MSRIVRIIAFGLGLIGATVASQAPEFAQQYRQRLGGAIDELRQIVGRFDADAQATGETRRSAGARLRANRDDLASRQGIAMQANIDRLERLQGHRGTMQWAGPFARVAVMVREGDRDVMREAYRDFEPAMPLTEEGVLAAVTGFAAAWGGILVLAALLRRFMSRRRTAHPVLRRA